MVGTESGSKSPDPDPAKTPESDRIRNTAFNKHDNLCLGYIVVVMHLNSGPEKPEKLLFLDHLAQTAHSIAGITSTNIHITPD